MERFITLGLIVIVGISIITGIVYSKQEQRHIAYQEKFNQIAQNEAATFVVAQEYADKYEDIYILQKKFNITNDVNELQKLNDELDEKMKELNLVDDNYIKAREEVLTNRKEY